MDHTLSNLDITILHNYETVKLEGSRTMYYRHRLYEVARVVGMTPDRFVILSEIGENPWRLSVPNPNPSSNLVGCRLYRVGDSVVENSPGMYVEVWDKLDEKSPLPGPEGELVHVVVACSDDEAYEIMNKYTEEKGIFEIGVWD